MDKLLVESCADVYEINESEYTGLLNSILEPLREYNQFQVFR
jgi:hypothetical protein